MKPAQLRQLLAEEAAKILAEEGQHDHLAAKRKAADRLRLPERHLPTNREIETALADRQRLFDASAQGSRLARLRRCALAAMDMLDNFQTRATGAAIRDTATAHDFVQLHVFTDTPEAVVFRLADMGLEWREGTCRMRWRSGRLRDIPLFTFQVEDERVDTLVFSLTELREAPVDVVDGQPMVRLSRRKLQQRLAQQR